MSDINQKIGKLVGKVRQRCGLTQGELARRLGTSQSAVNRIEHGKQNLSLKTLQRISDALNYDFISVNEIDLPRAEITENLKAGEMVIRIRR